MRCFPPKKNLLFFMEFLILIFHETCLFHLIFGFLLQSKIFKPRIFVYSFIPKVNRAKTLDLHVIKNSTRLGIGS